MEDCLFCKIASGQIPSDKFYEDEDVFAFLDIRPTTKGHALVIPKVHSTDLVDTADEVLSRLLPKIAKVARAVVAARQAAGFNLVCNTGSTAGQAVFHLHFHIIPRYADDGLVAWGHHESKDEERARIAEEIRKHLEN